MIYLSLMEEDRQRAGRLLIGCSWSKGNRNVENFSFFFLSFCFFNFKTSLTVSRGRSCWHWAGCQNSNEPICKDLDNNYWLASLWSRFTSALAANISRKKKPTIQQGQITLTAHSTYFLSQTAICLSNDPFKTKAAIVLHIKSVTQTAELKNNTITSQKQVKPIQRGQSRSKCHCLKNEA